MPSKSRPSTSKSQASQSNYREPTTKRRKDDSDDESQPKVGSKKMSPAEMQEFVKDTIIYVLSQSHHKLPIRRTEIVKHGMKMPGKMYQTIMKEVQNQLNEIYGLKLVDLDNTSQRYALLNMLDSKATGDLLTVPHRLRSKQGLLMIVLSVIFMSENVIAEGDMWIFLKQLQLVNDEPQMLHPLFGDVKKIMTVEFVRQMYLDYRRVPESDPPIMEFHWGQRALKEVSKKEILNFVSKMHADMDPKTWTTQWQAIEREEEENKSGGV